MSKPFTTADPSVSICVLQCLDNPSWNRSCINCEKHRELKARLSDTRRLVVALENELAEFRSSIGEKNDPITTTFPLEITAHIFKHYVSLHAKIEQYADSDGFYLISSRVALGLGAVCRLWRKIAWSIPQLWTTLVVDLQSEGYAHGPKLLKQWLERTNGLPLNVRVYPGCGQESLTDHEEANAKSAMKVLNRFFPQIRCLNVELLPFSLISTLTELEPDVTSNLQHFALGGGEEYDQDQDQDVESFTLFRISGSHEHKSPHRPSHVSLASSIQFDSLNIQWTNVTHVYLVCVSQATAFRVIKAAAQRLTYIKLSWIPDDDSTDFDVEDWLPASPIKLPSLVSLDMYSRAGFMEVVFNSIDCPSLTSLRYRHMGKERTMPVDAVIACIQRSSCSVKNLKLNWPQHPRHDVTNVTRVLHQLPALESLDLTLMSGQSVEPIFRALARPGRDGGRAATSGQTTFLRNLRDLKLEVFHSFSWTSFVNIWLTAQSRLPNDVPVGSNAHQLEGNLEVDPARNDLSVSMAVRGELRPSQHYVGKNELLALMRLSKVLRGSISVTADGGTRIFVVKNDEYDLLERSFLRHFPTDSKYLPLLKSMKKSSNFQ